MASRGRWRRRRVPERHPVTAVGQQVPPDHEEGDAATLAGLWSEALAGLFQRPSRSIMTAMGAALGIGSFVAVLGVTATANAQITERFNALAATQVEVRQSDQVDGGFGFPADADDRVRRLNGVRESTLLWNLSDLTVGTLPPGLDDSLNLEEASAPVMAATPGIWSIARPELAAGRTFDDSVPLQRVALVGEGLANTLGVGEVRVMPTIYLDDIGYTVIGVVRSTSRIKEPETSIVVPADVALQDFGPPVLPAGMVIETELGAAASVAEDAPVALDEFVPETFTAVPPVDPTTLQDNISSNLRSLFLFLSAICLLVGAIGIANANLVAVLDRTAEIGLRRALGGMPRQVAGQFLMESSLLGLLGGLVGTCLSIVAVIVLSLVRDWTPVIDPTLTVAAPFAGCVVGLVAGSYPAYRASRIDPVDAFRK